MDFRLRCDCWNELAVTEGSAGADLRCACGRLVSVPGLKELRLQAGLPPYDPSPELLLRETFDINDVPGDERCVECGAATDHIIRVVAECEKAWGKRAGFDWGTFFFSLLLAPFGILFRWREADQLKGRDKFFVLPIRVCPQCQQALQGETRIKECLRHIPVYRRLLDKFPEARVTVERE
jgi:hypothetical protein